MNINYETIEQLAEKQMNELGGASVRLRYSKRVAVAAWIKYDWATAKKLAYKKALAECKKWHDKGKNAFISSAGQEISQFAYYVTHD